MVDWRAHEAREEERYRDGTERLPVDADPRQRQLTRVANAAYGAGLAALMRHGEAAPWFVRAAERYRESLEGAPPGSWGRPIGAIKARLLADDWDGAARDAAWTLAEGAAAADSAIGRYGACLAALVAGPSDEARLLAESLRTDAEFPRAVADALAYLASDDALGYDEAVAAVLESFETREEHLEDVPVADTVLVLQALARRRGFAVSDLRSPLLPPETDEPNRSG